MELHTTGIVLLVTVTVDALACLFRAAEHIVDHHRLVVVLQTALVQCQFLVSDIAGRNQAIADIGIYRVRRYRYLEGAIALPLLIVPDKQLDADSLANGLRHQFTPTVHIRLHGFPTAHQFTVANLEAGHHLITGVLQFEGERCYINRYSHSRVVRIDAWRLIDLRKLVRHVGVAA